MCQVYGAGAVTNRTCPKWFAKFCAGHFSLDNAPSLGRSVEIDSDQIETLIDNNQCYTMQETADVLKISKSIKKWVKRKNVSFLFNFFYWCSVTVFPPFPQLVSPAVTTPNLSPTVNPYPIVRALESCCFVK